MKVIQNILAIFYSLPCSSLAFKLKTSGYPLYWRSEDKGGGGGQYSIFSTFLDSFLSNKQQRVRFEESSFSLFGLSKGPCRLPFVPHCCH